jgi:asparagine synthase (glutamine-hydrolysing)
MLVSLEARVPLLDHVLMEYAATIPASLKLRDGAGKHVFREAMRHTLPAGILARGKMGFGVPIERWFRAELRGYAREILLDRRTLRRGLLDPAGVTALLDEHQTGRRDRSSDIWALLCLEEWARRWLDR